MKYKALKTIGMIFIYVSFATQTLAKKSPHIITFFIKKYPEIEYEYNLHKVKSVLTNPYKSTAKQIKRHTRNWNNGIFSFYAGYSNISNGQITFPRRHQKPKFLYLIANKIKPSFMFPNTIQHFEISKGTSAAMYSVNLKKDQETKLHFWEVKLADIPEDRIIPSNTIVILAKPKNIFVPEGITPTTNIQQLLLPDIYAKKTINKVANAMFAINVRHFWGTIRMSSQQKNAITSKLIK